MKSIKCTLKGDDYYAHFSRFFYDLTSYLGYKWYQPWPRIFLCFYSPTDMELCQMRCHSSLYRLSSDIKEGKDEIN